METEKYLRKPFEVEAVQVTAENIDEVAQWCKGEVKEQNGNKYIKVEVARTLNEKQTMAFIGDWILFAGTGYKVYTAKAFGKHFTKVETENNNDLEELRTVTQPV